MALIEATYSQSSNYNGAAYPANFANMNNYNADGASGTGTSSQTDAWIKADAGSVQLIKYVVVGADINNNIPGGFGTSYLSGRVVEGSVNNSTWTTIATIPTYNAATWQSGMYEIPVNANYRYVRVINYSGYVAMTEFRLYNDLPGSDPPTVLGGNFKYNTTNSVVELPAHSVGDMILLALMNNASASAPTAPTGYTSITSSVNGYNAGYTRTGLTLCYKIATTTNAANAVSQSYTTGTNASSCFVHIIKNPGTTPIGSTAIANDTGGYTGSWNSPALTTTNKSSTRSLVLTYTTGATSWAITMVTASGILMFQTGTAGSNQHGTALAQPDLSSTSVAAKTFNQSGGAGFYNVVTAVIEIMPISLPAGFFAMF